MTERFTDQLPQAPDRTLIVGLAVWVGLVAAVAINMTPLNRFAAAPLALHWNRHR